MTERVKKELVDKNLETYNASLVGQNPDESSLIYDGKKIATIPTPKGWIYGAGLDKIRDLLHIQGNWGKSQIYADITKIQKSTRKEKPKVPKRPEKKIWRTSLETSLATSMLAIFTMGLVFFSSIRSNLITGAVVGNLSNTTSNTIIVLCACGILGVLYFRRIRTK